MTSVSKQTMVQKSISEEEKEEKEEEKEEEAKECFSDRYNKDCNKFLLKRELLEHDFLETKEGSEENDYLYPTLNDPNFNIKIAEKK